MRTREDPSGGFSRARTPLLRLSAFWDKRVTIREGCFAGAACRAGIGHAVRKRKEGLRVLWSFQQNSAGATSPAGRERRHVPAIAGWAFFIAP